MESPDTAQLWQQAKRNAVVPLQAMGTGFIYNLLNDMRPPDPGGEEKSAAQFAYYSRLYSYT